LPFAALPTKPVRLRRAKGPLFSSYRKVPWLVRRASVTMLPSVAALKNLRSRRAGSPGRRPFLGFGAPLFNGNRPRMVQKPVMEKKKVASRKDDRTVSRNMPLAWRSLRKTRDLDSLRLPDLSHIPETAAEVRSVARALRADSNRDVYLGSRASEDTLKQMDLANRKVVLFATHGLLPGDLNGLTQPALAFSSPGAAGGESDGLLTMSEILGLRLDADWVVLPSFGGMSGKVPAAKALSSLERAFFYAGARALLMSSWPVESTSARRLMTSLFRRQARAPRRPRAAILRRAMLDLLDGKGYVDKATGKTVFSYAHPIFWAPFTIIGDGGRPAIARN
jgi:CHAT domain-containing protein